jgi:hypothetical protein
MDAEYQAVILAEAGDKKMHPNCIEALCTNKYERLMQAKELYEKAANNFKLMQKWFEAGQCFEKCAFIEEANKDDPSNYYEEAAHCFKFCDINSKYY